MLLKQLTTSTDRKLAKINRYLKESFGFTLNSNVKTETLEKMYEKLERELHEMKLDNKTPQDSEYSKKLLMREGIVSLLEKQTLTENVGLQVQDIKNKVVAWLCDYACQCINIGDSVDDAVNDAMRHYRSSKYRFPDQVVEQLLRNSIHEKMGSDTQHATLYDSVYEDIDTNTVADAVFTKIQDMYPEIVSEVGADYLGTVIDDVAQMHSGELTPDAVARLVSSVIERVPSDLNESDDLRDLSAKRDQIENSIHELKKRYFPELQARKIIEPGDPVLDRFTESDKNRYLELLDLRGRISDAMNQIHRSRQAYSKPTPSIPVYPGAKSGQRYMGDSVEEGLGDFFKRGEKYVPQIGDAVQKKSKPSSKGIVVSVRDDECEVAWDAQRISPESIKNLVKIQQSDKFNIGNSVVEKKDFARVGIIWSIGGGNKFEVRWNEGTYSTVDENKIELTNPRINEVAPPGMEDWIKDRKEEFKKRYGDRWEEVLYATAWKMANRD